MSNFSRLTGKRDVLIEREIEPRFRGILHFLTLGCEDCCGASGTANGRTNGCSFAASDRADGRSDTGAATDDCSILALRGFGFGRVRFRYEGNSLTACLRRPGKREAQFPDTLDLACAFG